MIKYTVVLHKSAILQQFVKIVNTETKSTRHKANVLINQNDTGHAVFFKKLIMSCCFMYGLFNIRCSFPELRKWHQDRNEFQHLSKLEQLESLRSEDTPAGSWLPILLSHIGSQVKRRQSQSYKYKEFANLSNIDTSVTHDTHSEVAW